MFEGIGSLIFFILFVGLFIFYMLGQILTDGCLHAVIREYFYGHPKGSPCTGATKALDNEGQWIEGHWYLPDGGHYTDPDVLIKHYLAGEVKKKKETVH
jgi:hypothetical protein